MLKHGTGFMSMLLPVWKITSILKTNSRLMTWAWLLTIKKLLHFTIGKTGSPYDPRLLRYSAWFKDIQSGGCILNKPIILGDFGEIPLVTISNTAFPNLEWILKCFSKNTFDLKELYCNKKPCSARVVTDNFLK